MAFDELLAGRVRNRFQHVAGVSEKKMFGGLAFMTGGHLPRRIVALSGRVLVLVTRRYPEVKALARCAALVRLS